MKGGLAGWLAAAAACRHCGPFARSREILLTPTRPASGRRDAHREAVPQWAQGNNRIDCSAETPPIIVQGDGNRAWAAGSSAILSLPRWSEASVLLPREGPATHSVPVPMAFKAGRDPSRYRHCPLALHLCHMYGVHTSLIAHLPFPIPSSHS